LLRSSEGLIPSSAPVVKKVFKAFAEEWEAAAMHQGADGNR
jgi:hypothetical protein